MKIGGNFLQSRQWAEVNKRLGHKVFFENGILMVVKDAKRGRFLEVPGGPLINWEDETEKNQVFEKIKQTARKEKCVFVRFRPQLLNTKENQKLLSGISVPAPFHLYAQNTVILDLEKPLDDILSEMRRQTRYEVRRTSKLGIEVKKGHSKADFQEFHLVQVETAKRKGFIPPSAKELEVYNEVFDKNAVIYKATKEMDGENPAIAYGLIIKSGEEADYFEAASTELNNKLPGSYAVLWEAIKDAKKEGYKRFNLWGIAPPDPKTHEYQKNHRYSGVTTFKTGFGGEQINFIPAQDIVINPLRYRITKIVEEVRKKWRHL